MSRRQPKVGFVSLGCPKALVDSERIITQLRSEGYQVAADYGSADVVVVNTCGFIDSAVDESLDAIGEALEQNGKVIVTGCLGARPERILERHPKASAAEARSVRRPRAAAGHPAHAAALRVSEDLRRLQQQVQLLHHPIDARVVSQPADR
jgi:tRNA A37 methylthiotransferase MiaB